MRNNRLILFLIALPALWLLPGLSAAQDFLLEGCFWHCSPGEEPSKYIRQFQREAPLWKHAGFSGLRLPEIPAAQAATLGPLGDALRAGGLEPLVYLSAPPAAGDPGPLLAAAKTLRERYRIRDFHIGPGLEAWHYAALLNVALAENVAPEIVVADPGTGRNAASIAAWINAVYDQIPDADAPRLFPRALDYPLRDALYKASTDNNYDVRNLFSAGLRDASSLTGFHAVTFVNASFLPEQEKIADPLLAYAYMLSNNQLGLPMVHLEDYRNLDVKDAIDQLMEAHRLYIFNSIEIEYLNRPGSDRSSVFLSKAQGADERRALLFQIEGRNTPAGRAHATGGSRDVLVAINFSNAPLKVIQELNASNIQPGDRFHDVLGNSDTPELALDAGVSHNISNAVYIELPPRSYSIWVQGETGIILPGEIRFGARRESAVVELNWEAPSDPDIRHYELERSTDGGTFELILRVDALPAASESAYLHLDENTQRGRRYAYRVKAVKSEGYFFSPVANIEVPAERIRFEVAPGNGPGERRLRVRSNVEGQAEMKIFDKTGKVVFTQDFAIKTGEEFRPIPLAPLERGVYWLEIRINGERVWAERLIRL